MLHVVKGRKKEMLGQGMCAYAREKKVMKVTKYSR